MDFIKLGQRIRDERLLLRLTLEQLAERIDKSVNYIGQIERAEGKPSIETLVDIANALGTTVDKFLKDDYNINSFDNDIIIREIVSMLCSTDEKGKQFILDMIKRYSYHHKNM